MLSVCMIVKNEACNLPRAIRSVIDIADELVVVDTGSTDSTKQVASIYNARIFDFDFSTPDFSAVRNFAIDKARGSWVLMIDADETLERSCVEIFRRIVEQDIPAAYMLPRDNHLGGHAFSIDSVVRLFPKLPGFRYTGRVHEGMEGVDHRRAEVILHHWVVPAVYKHVWYAKILQEELKEKPDDINRLVFLAAEYHQLGQFHAAKIVAERITKLKPSANAQMLLEFYQTQDVLL